MNPKDIIFDIVRDIVPGNDIDKAYAANCDLVEEFGLNSLDMMELIVKLEETFGISIDLATFDLAYFNDVSQLVVFVESIKSSNKNE